MGAIIRISFRSFHIQIAIANPISNMAEDAHFQVMLLEHYFAIHIFLDEGMPAKQGERKRNVGRHVGFLFVA
ncbi:MAG: hypothetical protein KC708_25515, partial [Anaerolineae bacterium]|nr:hypothetical protein [Anaerolineae bacterium]